MGCFHIKYPRSLVLILDGNTEIGAHVKSNLCYLISVRHFIRSRTVTNRIFFSDKTNFSSKQSELPSYIISTIRGINRHTEQCLYTIPPRLYVRDGACRVHEDRGSRHFQRLEWIIFSSLRQQRTSAFPPPCALLQIFSG